MDNSNSSMYLRPEPSKSKSKSKKKIVASRGKGRKRAIVESDESDEEVSNKRPKVEATEDAVKATPILAQPSLITGATLKPYQLEGLHWMASLHANGISGILGMSHFISCLIVPHFNSQLMKWVSARWIVPTFELTVLSLTISRLFKPLLLALIFEKFDLSSRFLSFVLSVSCTIGQKNTASLRRM